MVRVKYVVQSVWVSCVCVSAIAATGPASSLGLTHAYVMSASYRPAQGQDQHEQYAQHDAPDTTAQGQDRSHVPYTSDDTQSVANEDADEESSSTSYDSCEESDHNSAEDDDMDFFRDGCDDEEAFQQARKHRSRDASSVVARAKACVIAWAIWCAVAIDDAYQWLRDTVSSSSNEHQNSKENDEDDTHSL